MDFCEAVGILEPSLVRNTESKGHIFRTKEELEGLRCSLEERKKILASRPHTFEGWQKMFITYTLAWESDNLWKIVLYILDNMCGNPYNAEHKSLLTPFIPRLQSWVFLTCFYDCHFMSYNV